MITTIVIVFKFFTSICFGFMITHNSLQKFVYKVLKILSQKTRLKMFSLTSALLLHQIQNKIFKIPYLKKLIGTYFNNKLSKGIISRKYNFIYIENPLCATSTFFRFLLKEPPIDFEAKMENLTLEKLNGKYKSFLKFSVVRNPWSRVVSCYNKKILNAMGINVMAIISQYDGLFPRMRFEDFVNWLCSEKGQDSYSDPHWISQHSILCGNSGSPIYNYLIKLENFEEGIRNLFEKLGLPFCRLPKAGLSEIQLIKPLYKSWKEYYLGLDNKTIKDIEKRYEKDAKIFSYPKLRETLKSI